MAGKEPHHPRIATGPRTQIELNISRGDAILAATVREHALKAWLIMGTLLATCAAVKAEAPLGHKDFYPSPERPVGFRGDGNGWFPGATPVAEWWEGTPVQSDRTFRDKWGAEKSGKAWDFTDNQPKNIVWKTKLPSWANSQPIVVGDRVFCTGEPDWLICADARTGKILWAERQNVWQIAGNPPADAARAQRLFDIYRETIPATGGMTGDGTMGRLLPPEEFKAIADLFCGPVLPRVVAALKKADPATSWDEMAAKQVAAYQQYVEKLAELKASGKLGSKGLDNDKPRDLEILRRTIQQRIHAIVPLPKLTKTSPGPMLDSPWGNLVGFAVAVPVSDGQFVYASFAQGQTVCYTLDGKRVWAVYREQERDGSRMSHAQSMRLAGGVLVDMHGGTKSVAGLDTRTGQQLWEAPTKGEFAFGKAGGYYVASHALMPLKNGNKTEHVLVTSRHNIIRARDGKVLGPLPFEHGSSGGPSLSYDGDIIYRVICGDNTRTPLAAFRLSLQGDTIKAEKLWETPKQIEAQYQGYVALPGYYLLPTREGAGFEALTGKTVAKGAKVGGLSNLVVGKTWLWLRSNSNSDPLHSSWGGRRSDGKALAIFEAADVTDPSAPKSLDAKMILGGTEFPSMSAMQELAPELYALPQYGHNSWGKPMFSVHTDNCIFPQGNRLFIRTLAHLYCIGDPNVPYDWNPKSRSN
jgi:hypothetical protein